MMDRKKDNVQIKDEFRMRQNRQFLAIAVTLLILLFLVLIYKRTDLFGQIPKDIVFIGQILTIAAFIGFSAFNWRCPSCKRYLGADIGRHICNKCGTRLH